MKSIIFVACVLLVGLGECRGGRRNRPMRCADGSRPVKMCSDGTVKQKRTPCPDMVPAQKSCTDGSEPVAIQMPGRCADNSKPSCPNGEVAQRRCTDGQAAKRRNQCADRAPPKKRCSDGSLPLFCEDGSTPAPRRNQN